jgi:hypothetical protein
VLNRATGCRARRQSIGEETGEPAEANAQVKEVWDRRARCRSRRYRRRTGSELDVARSADACLSYLGPDSLINARYLIRRIRRKLPRAQILVGLWTTEGVTRRDALIEGGGLRAVVAPCKTRLMRFIARARSAAGDIETSTRQSPVVKGGSGGGVTGRILTTTFPDQLGNNAII